MSPPSRAMVLAALESVVDPHVPVSLRRLGMLHEVEVGPDGAVRVELCVPCTACPGVAELEAATREAVGRLEGVSRVVVEAAFHLPWSRELVDEGARELMRRNGIQI